MNTLLRIPSISGVVSPAIKSALRSVSARPVGGARTGREDHEQDHPEETADRDSAHHSTRPLRLPPPEHGVQHSHALPVAGSAAVLTQFQGVAVRMAARTRDGDRGSASMVTPSGDRASHTALAMAA